MHRRNPGQSSATGRATIADIQPPPREADHHRRAVNSTSPRHHGPTKDKGVEEPKASSAPSKTFATPRAINALGTLNLRPAARKALAFDDPQAPAAFTDAVVPTPQPTPSSRTAAKLEPGSPARAS